MSNRKLAREPEIVFAPLWLDCVARPDLRDTLMGRTGRVEDPMKTLKALCRDDSPDTIARITLRSKALEKAVDGLDMFISPDENRIRDKLVMPLRSAKQAYCLGDFLGCIALCGFVCEMAAVFLAQLASEWLDLDRLSPEYKRVFGKRTIEKCGQQERVRALKEVGVINDEIAVSLDCVRKKRRQYLHFLSKSHKHIEHDALDVYVATCAVIKPLVHIASDEKGLHVPEHLTSYLGVSVAERN